MSHWAQQMWFGNTVQAYALAIGFLVAGWIGVWVLKLVVLSRLKRWAERTTTTLDDFVIRTFEKTAIPLAYVSILLAAVKSLTLPHLLSRSLAALWAVVVMLAVVRAALGVIHHALFQVWLKSRTDREVMERHLRGLMPIVNIGVWSMGLVLLLDNLGFKVTAIMAGLGIGGVAVALAAQAVLADLFSYMAILLDKPFEIDDFIIAGDSMGTVERIGIKTTRIRSLSGEELIFSNKDLTDSRVRNLKRMQLRRVVFKLGVAYDTPLEKLKRAVEITKDAILHTPGTRFDRVHFASYGNSNLIIEAVYFVLSADYNKYMDVQQTINFRIKEVFEKEEVGFASPT